MPRNRTLMYCRRGDTSMLTQYVVFGEVSTVVRVVLCLSGDKLQTGAYIRVSFTTGWVVERVTEL